MNVGMSIKWCFDRIASFAGLIFLSPLCIGIIVLIALSDGLPVFFVQTRIGRMGKPFRMVKFRTMRANSGKITVTASGDGRIFPVGRVLRRWKLDELPELWNVFIGDMSLVGPRPDVPGYADRLVGEDRRLLQLRPGITGPATLQYLNEEAILQEMDDPIQYNDEVIFPHKVRINLWYLENWSMILDFKIICWTLFRKHGRRFDNL